MIEQTDNTGNRSDEELGRPTDIYRANSGDVVFGSIINLLGVGAITLFIPFLVLFWSVGGNKVDRAFEVAAPRYAPLIIVVWLAFMGFMVFRTIRWSSALGKLRIMIYPQALVVEYGPGEKVVCPWDDIASAEDGLELDGMDLIRINFLIVRKDGASFAFTAERMGRDRLLALSGTIAYEVDRRLAAPLKEQIYSAEGARFEGLTLTREGLTDGVKTIPWNDVEDIQSKLSGTFSIKGTYIITRKSGEDGIRFSHDLPDIRLLVSLIRELAGLSAPHSQRR